MGSPSASETAKAATQGNLQPLKDNISDLKHTAQAKLDAAAQSLPSNTAELKEDVKEAGKKAFQSLRDFAAGGVGGVCSVVVGHPFDLVKVRLQTAESGVYKGAMDVVRKTVAREGLAKGMYAGVSAPLVGVTPIFAINFWAYGVGKQLVESFSNNKTGQLTVAQVSAAGLFSAIPMTVVTAPFERVKIILQIQGQKELAPGEKPRYSGGVDVVRQLYKEGGLRSVYRGSLMTFARDGPGSAAYFATYETIKRYLTPKDPVTGKAGELSIPAVMAAGGAAGVAMWTAVFPLDTVKSRLQSSEKSQSISACVKELYGKGGVKAFFPGIGPAMARAVPANAATFVGVELAHKLMDRVF
ncbi:mitochondrial carrier [Dissoconium aciculare CBS 342.82]|uniref:Mitochondrial carrier n=1 Tax=Dissoconium aciculare CBS 342.82 TaxID=1314786 RepID=A0A6J3LV09_9PEZI|nr:mitochondrial carrier [Dissoconium aciculare CBS 342.82]KAF1818467.1 mitochondrial carrier [Dissoconium aciculare CBS 342.82]